VLVGRSGLPAKEQWEQWLATHDPEDAISCKIQKVQALEALAEVLIISADVANHAQMQAAIAQSLKRFQDSRHPRRSCGCWHDST